MKNFSIIANEAKKHKTPMLIGIGFVLIAKFFVIAPTLLLSSAVDAFSEQNIRTALQHTLLMIVLSFVALLLVPWQGRYMASLEQKLLDNLFTHWAKELLSKTFETFSQLKIGGVIETFYRGWNAYEMLLRFLFSIAIPFAIEILLLTAYLMYVGAPWLLFIILTLSASLLLLLLAILNKRKPVFQSYMQCINTVTVTRGEIFSLANFLKLSNHTSFVSSHLKKAYKDFVPITTLWGVLSMSFDAAKDGLSAIASAVILLCGVYILQHDEVSAISAGTFVVLYFYCTRLMEAIFHIFEGFMVYSDFHFFQKDFSDILSLAKERENIQALPADKASLLKAPSIVIKPFAYELPKTSLTIKNPESILIPHASTCAISGASGQGKTTLAEILSGIKTSEDIISLADMDISQIDEHSLRKTVLLTEHQTSFLPGNIQEALGLETDTGTALDHALLKDYLQKLELQHIINEKDAPLPISTLSSGEKKRLGLLRAMLLHHPVVILDEPTEALDKAVAQRVWQHLFSSFTGRTLICLTHDEDILHHFDQRIHLENHTLTVSVKDSSK